ncbi:hypothetical protein [Acetobacterium malicum]|uniref:hypothetical protein n=1 Tax=Acetobacterium malicum TaxID=52692 RepID=UPI0003F7ADCB|nr:hypothetical protein [Acetobacterium dehalogenans]
MKMCEQESNDLTAESIYRSIYLFNQDKYEFSKWIRKADNLDGISIYFFKNLIAKIKFSKSLKSYFIAIPDDYSEFFASGSFKPMPPVKNWSRYLVNDFESLNHFKDSFSELYLFFESDYSDNSEFGCCHLYNECSDEKKCIQQNVTFSNRCYYKKNLNDGRIFYGENRNV